MFWYNTVDDSSVFMPYKQNYDESKRFLQLINISYACLCVYIPICDYSVIWICTDNICKTWYNCCYSNISQWTIFIYVLPLEIQVWRGVDWDHICRFNPATLLCLSQARTWNPSVICRGIFLCSVSLVKMICDCSLCGYWWNLWNFSP